MSLTGGAGPGGSRSFPRVSGDEPWAYVPLTSSP